MSDRMMTEPLRDITEICGNCKKVDWTDNSNTGIAKTRSLCAKCHLSGGGIYKADIVRSALTYKEKANATTLPTGKGKSSTFIKNYGKIVDGLTAEGKTQREIAELLGVSKTTINKYLKNTLKK